MSYRKGNIMPKTQQDYEKLAGSIIELIGGRDNIVHAAHCVTRLRITPKNTALVKLDELKKLGVIGAQMVGDQVQVIIGNEINEVYDAFVKVSGIERTAAIKENLDKDLVPGRKSFKDIIGSILPTIVACVFPALPALIATGMLQALTLILVNLHVVPASSPTIATLSWIANTSYYFLPVLIGAFAAKRFGSNQALGILMGCILLSPTFAELVKIGAGTPGGPGGPPVPGTGNAGFLFGMPIYPADYSNTIIPVILCVWIMSYIEKFLNRHIPKSVRVVFVPLLTILVMAPLALLLIAPLGHRLSGLFAMLLGGLYHAFGPLALALLAAFYPFIVMAGLHFNLMAVAIAEAQTVGKNRITHPVGFIYQATQGAACLAVAAKTKNADRRALALSCAFNDLVPGISEPGLYGITFKYKKPMYGAMIGAMIASFFVALMGVGSYAGGPPNLFTLGLFIQPGTGNTFDLRWMIVGIILSIVIAFAATFFLYSDEDADRIDAAGI